MTLQRVIFCEDKYGVAFLKELTNRLKSNGLIRSNFGVNISKFYGACNAKLGRQLLAKSKHRNCRFIILVDADGKNKRILRNRVEKHVPINLANNTNIVVLDFEIEDWICVSLGIGLNNINRKPSVLLKQRFGYEKNHLKSYLPKLDFQKLLQQCSSFCDFVNSL